MTGREFKILREQVGTQFEVAQLFERKPNTISRYEQMTRVPAMAALAIKQLVSERQGKALTTKRAG